ncbi:MAG: translation initiation factor IF-2 subunit beta [Nanoarchaeota archaeon]
MELNYEKLLEKAKSKLPELKESKERFEIPQVQGHIQGNKTIISNFSQICSILRRPPEQLLKYLQRELATPAEIDGPRLILGRKISSSTINQKIVQYGNDFVLCRECHKPDTQMYKEDRILFLKCMVCGAKQPIRAKIN